MPSATAAEPSLLVVACEPMSDALAPLYAEPKIEYAEIYRCWEKLQFKIADMADALSPATRDVILAKWALREEQQGPVS